MKTLSLEITEALNRKLAALVRRKGVHRSIVVREALSRYLDESPEVRRGSFLDLAGDLFGCVKTAPPDLSSNPRRLAGFGK